MSSTKQIPLQAEGDMKRNARSVRNVVLAAVLLAVFLQVQIFYGLVKLSIVSSDGIPILNSNEWLSSKRIGISISDQDRDFKNIQLNQNFQNVSSHAAASNSTRKANTKLTLRPHGYAQYSFVQFSAYRESQRVFYVVGITSKVLRDFDHPVYKCRWQKTSNSSTLSSLSSITDANMIYVYFDQMPRIYVVAIVNCTFKEDVGGDGGGGSLFMTVSTGPHHGDTQEVLALEELKGEAKVAALGAEGHDNSSLPFKFAFCSPPIHGSIRADWLLHWLIYHHYIWRESVHFFFYNAGGITDTIRQLILPFLEKDLVTILDVEDQKKYPSWYFNQLLFINDCLHRTKYLSSWTFFHDFDEFLALSLPNMTLDNLLHQHMDAPFLTFGSVRASLWMCAETPPDSSDWPLQRMLWFEKQPYCYVPDQDPWLCIHGEGARKYAVNPRKVFASGVHRTAIPAEGGVNLNVSIAKLVHYPGALSNTTSFCSSSFNVSTPLQVLHHIAPSSQIFMRDDYISMEMKKARDFHAKWQVGSAM